MTAPAGPDEPLLLTAEMMVRPGAAALLRDSAKEVAAVAAEAMLLLHGGGGVRAASAALPAGLARSVLSPVVVPATAPKGRPARGFALAVGLHAAVLAAVFGVFHHRHKAKLAAQDVVIAMALESAPAGAAPPAPAVVKPAPVVTPAPVVPVALPVPVVEKPADLPKPAPVLPAPPRVVARPAPVAPPAPAAPPGPAAPPRPASAVQVATIPAHPDAASNNPPPDYPLLSRDRGEEGVVVLSIHVLADGLPGDVTVAQSSGYPALDDAARDAVLRWHFDPAMKDGAAVDFMLPYRILFQLR